MLIFAFISPTTAAMADIVPKKIDVRWATQLAAAANGGQTDSASVNYSTAALRVDTTTAISIGDALLPPPFGGGFTVTGDSLGWLRFSFRPISSNVAVTADSVYIILQVSDNGIAWMSLTPTRVFAAAGLLGADLGLIALENGTSNQFVAVVRQQVAGVASGVFFPFISSTTVPTWLNAYGYKYIRFLVQSDITGQYDGEVSYFAKAP